MIRAAQINLRGKAPCFFVRHWRTKNVAALRERLNYQAFAGADLIRGGHCPLELPPQLGLLFFFCYACQQSAPRR